MKVRNVNDWNEIEEIIRKSESCTLSMVDSDGLPYAVPMNFGYYNGLIFLHSAPEGKKIGVLKQNPNVCVSFSTDHFLRWQNKGVACSYSMKYRSVLMFGTIEFLEDMTEKEVALDCIMKHFKAEDYRFSEPAVRNVCVMRLRPTKTEGRAYGY
ncbi:pyridoxamine 5'-phosphate oxidase family protein [Bacteroidales bacterium]